MCWAGWLSLDALQQLNSQACGEGVAQSLDSEQPLWGWWAVATEVVQVVADDQQATTGSHRQRRLRERSCALWFRRVHVGEKHQVEQFRRGAVLREIRMYEGQVDAQAGSASCCLLQTHR